ncbi:aKG-HExxH-type peptide beta-hydroxylase [Candidatus Leptofilum sp.]|uniref:aKG-HExxH-type peptide beta-hydroxylase n=1 Tax=Candidatus Leptofilum sp. TaxID=3241576 RepID=UPI003B5933DC
MSGKNDEVIKFNVEAVCRIDDYQDAYLIAMKDYVHRSASRFLAVLTILKQSGYRDSDNLLEVFDNLEATTSLFLEYRELDALAISLVRAYSILKDSNQIQKCLNEILLAISSFSEFLVSENLETVINPGEIVSFPLLEKSIQARQPLQFGELLNIARFTQAEGTIRTQEYILLAHKRNQLGTRRFLGTRQPSEAENEYSIFEFGDLPETDSVAFVDYCLMLVSNLDLKLRTLMSELYKTLTICPRTPQMRQAGSVSSLPGWVWQDVDPNAHYEEEFPHLITQLVHEFFHTKLNIVEKYAKIWNTDGRTPLLFSPWKDRNRPIRQVIHALMTFSAGGVALKQTLDIPRVSSSRVEGWAVDYWRENLSFAKDTEKVLINSGALTKEGELLVKSIVHNFNLNVSELIR